MSDSLDKPRTAFPDYGPDWQAAIDFGIDVSLIEENLKLTVDERFAQLLAMTRFAEALDEARARSLDAIRAGLKSQA